jgi:hypothetical protein
MIFIVSAPSGAGKTTLCDKLQAEFKSLHYAITATTRPARDGEVDGKHYYFLSEEEFDRRLKAGDFFETAIVHGFRYGSPKSPVIEALMAGRDVLMNLDVQGAAVIRKCVAAAPPGDVASRAGGYLRCTAFARDVEEAIGEEGKGYGGNDRAKAEAGGRGNFALAGV